MGVTGPTGDRELQTARRIWGALVGAVAMYLVVLVVLVGRGEVAPLAEATLMRTVLRGIAAAETAAVLVVARWLLPGVGPTMPALARYVLCWALAESIALLGFVLGTLTRTVADAQPFFIVAAALLLWLRPRADHFPPRA